MPTEPARVERETRRLDALSRCSHRSRLRRSRRRHIERNVPPALPQFDGRRGPLARARRRRDRERPHSDDPVGCRRRKHLCALSPPAPEDAAAARSACVAEGDAVDARALAVGAARPRLEGADLSRVERPARGAPPARSSGGEAERAVAHAPHEAGPVV